MFFINCSTRVTDSRQERVAPRGWRGGRLPAQARWMSKLSAVHSPSRECAGLYYPARRSGHPGTWPSHKKWARRRPRLTRLRSKLRIRCIFKFERIWILTLSFQYNNYFFRNIPRLRHMELAALRASNASPRFDATTRGGEWAVREGLAVCSPGARRNAVPTCVGSWKKRDKI